MILYQSKKADVRIVFDDALFFIKWLRDCQATSHVVVDLESQRLRLVDLESQRLRSVDLESQRLRPEAPKLHQLRVQSVDLSLSVKLQRKS